MRRTISHPEASKLSFDMVQKLATDSPEDSVTGDNFAGLIAVLDDFATAAGAAVEGQRQDKRGAAIAL
jgi:brefeldin A-resistance guanine nucleotide exchange factor 1